MAETIQKELDLVEKAITDLEQALPQIIGMKTQKEGLKYILLAADSIKEMTFDPQLRGLATTLKVLCNSTSTALRTSVFQAYITEILEMLVNIKDSVRTSGLPKSTDAVSLKVAGEFLIRFAGRVTNRYKINVVFEPDYEAKAIRAFMVLKELSEICRFLNMSPDLTVNSTPNLDGGLEIDVLTQESAEELHRIVGSVLEVKGIQIFTETMNQQVMMLDPPDLPDSFDNKVEEFLKG